MLHSVCESEVYVTMTYHSSPHPLEEQNEGFANKMAKMRYIYGRYGKIGLYMRVHYSEWTANKLLPDSLDMYTILTESTFYNSSIIRWAGKKLKNTGNMGKNLGKIQTTI